MNKFSILSTTLLIMSCNHGYSNNVEYELSDFTFSKIEGATAYEDGTLEESGNKIIYDGKMCYDLQTVVSKVSRSTNYIFGSSAGNYNLIAIPNKDSNICELLNGYNTDKTKVFKVKIPSNTNLIIQEGVTLNMNNNIQLWFEQDQTNNSILILGNITRDLEQDANKVVKDNIHIAKITKYDVDYNLLILFGPCSSVTTNKDRVFEGDYAIIKSANTHLNWVLYPGCNLGDNAIISEDGTQMVGNNCLFRSNGTIYLNRCYSANTDAGRNTIQGLVNSSMNIVIPEYTEIENILHTKHDGKYDNEYKYFNKLFYSNDGSGLCIKETPSRSIFKLDGNEKQVLYHNENNKFAKYDAVFWNQCKVESGIYSFTEFVNTESNKDKYINVDDLEDLFTDGKTYRKTGLLQNMPNEIFPGLIGENNTNIKFYATQDTLKLHGDNSEYTGTMTIPPTIHEVYIFNKNSIVKNISYKEKQYTVIIDEDNKIYLDNEKYSEINPEDIGLTFHYVDKDNINECNHKWDLFKEGNKLDINLNEEE